MKPCAVAGRRFPVWRCAAAGIAALAGLASTVFADSHVAFLASVVIASAMGVVGILLCVSKPSAASLWEVYAFILCIGYGLGTLQTFVGGYFLAFDPFALADVSARALSGAISLVMLLVCLLLVCSLLDRKGLLADTRIPSSEHRLVLSLVSLLTLAAVAMVAAGRIRFQGDVAADADVGVRLSAIASLVSQALCPIGALGVYCARSSSPRMRFALLALAAIDLLILATQGRRLLLFALLIFAMAYAAGGKALRVFTSKTLMAALIMIFAVVVGNRFFYAMRLAHDENTDARDVASLAVRSGEIFMNPQDSGLDEKIKENLAERAFILDYLAELLEKLDRIDPLGGAVLFNAVITATPEALYPWKYKYMYYMEEGLVHPHFGMPVWDAANTVLTAGASDFGIFGLLAYPVLTVLLCQLLLRAATVAGPIVSAAMCFALLNMLLNVENQLPGIVAGVRDAILLGFVVFVVSLLFGQLRSIRLNAPRIA